MGPGELFRNFLIERLGQIRFATVAVLKALISQPVPTNLASLGFAVVDAPTERFPVIVFGSDRHGLPLTRENSTYIRELCDAFRGLPPLFSEQEEVQFVVWETIDDDGPVDALEQPTDGWEEAIFIPWFSDCWARAGGANFARPAAIEAHADARTTLR